MLKQISLFALAVLFTCTAVTAQDANNFKFGLQISPTISWMNTDDNRITNQGTALGLKLATQAEYVFADKYSVASGIGFHFNTGGSMQSQYGGRFFTESLPTTDAFNQTSEANQPDGPVLIDYSIQYVEIPLSLKLRTREFGTLTYYMEAPIFTLGIRSNALGGLSGGGVTQEVEDLSIKKEVNPLAFSWGFGGGVEYSILDGTRIFGGLTFQRMFLDATKDGDDYNYKGRDALDDPKATINSLTLRLGVLF
ncbi:MAG: PorT family protein [Saprospiraceae bacterium]